MFKKFSFLLIIILCGLVLGGCTLKPLPAALLIKSTPEANIFLDGKLLGKTPYRAEGLKPGEVTLKLIPDSTEQNLVSWEGKIKLSPGVLTSVERVLGPTREESSGQVLTLEKTKAKEPSLSVISDPDGALVKVDSESKGFTPLTLEKVAEKDLEIVISKEGYTQKTFSAKTVSGYRLVANVQLAKIASPSAITPTPVPSTSGQVTKKVVIKETPTGWLRVRETPSTSAKELAKVNPKEEYPLLEEKAGWYKIEYEAGKEGWISATYAEKK